MEHPGGSGSVFEGSWSRISIDQCVSRTPRHRRILYTTSPRRIASRFFIQEKSHSRLFCSSLRSPFSTSLLERTKHASVRQEKRTRWHTYTLYYYCAWSSNSWYSIQSILLRPRELIRRQILNLKVMVKYRRVNARVMHPITDWTKSIASSRLRSSVESCFPSLERGGWGKEILKQYFAEFRPFHYK